MPKASTKAARATRGSPRKLVAELRCRQCPDLPLRTQCPHSVEGKHYLKRQAEKTERAPQRCNRCPDRPLRSQCVHTSNGREFLRQRDIEQTLTTAPLVTNSNGSVIDGNIATTIQLEDTPLGDPPALHNPSGATIVSSHSPAIFPSTPPTLIAGWRLSQVAGTSIPINRLELPSTPTGNNEVPGSSQTASYTPRSELSVGQSSTFSSDVFGSTSASTPASQPSYLPLNPKKKYERPTKTNPKFGYVNGAMRGSDELAILRKHSRPSPSKDSTSASKDFLEGIHRVLEKAEDVALRTGCWIFVGAQHPGAVSGTIHYTSQRLRRDAPEDMERIVNDYNILMTSLLRARRADALEASKKLEEACQRNAALQKEVLALKTVIEQFSTRDGPLVV